MQSRGTLLIIGGGLKDDNAQIYGRFIELAGPGALIGVIPTATGEDNPGQDTLAILRTFALSDQRVTIIPIFKEEFAKASDPAIVAQIDACSALWFVGGDQSRILAVFRPEHRATPAYDATLRVLARGGVIAGTSAGAAIMSDPMITGGTSADALAHGATWTSDPGEDDGVGLARGMGYLPGALVDQHFLERGRLGRLLVAMRAANLGLGYGIAENAALEVDLATSATREWGELGVTTVRLRDGRAKASVSNPIAKPGAMRAR